MAEVPFEAAALELKAHYAAKQVGSGMIALAYNHANGVIAVEMFTDVYKKAVNAGQSNENGYVAFVEPVAAEGIELIEEGTDDAGNAVRRLKRHKIDPADLKVHHNGNNWYLRIYKFGTAEPQLVRFDHVTRRLAETGHYVVDAKPEDFVETIPKRTMNTNTMAAAAFIKKHIKGYENLYAKVGGEVDAASNAKAILDSKPEPRPPVKYSDLKQVGGRPPVPDSARRREAAARSGKDQAQAEEPKPAGASRASVPGLSWLEFDVGHRHFAIQVPSDASEQLARDCLSGKLQAFPQNPEMVQEKRFARHLPKPAVKDYLKARATAGAVDTATIVLDVSEGKIHPEHVDFFPVCNRLYGIIHELNQEWPQEDPAYRIETITKTKDIGYDADAGTYIQSHTAAYRAVPVMRNGHSKPPSVEVGA